jgi:hypothetical protein
MSQVIKIEDFNKGRFRVARTTWQNDDVQEYIDEQEVEYLIRLLGLELYNLFNADLDPSGVPQSPRFLDIYNAFVIDNECFGFYDYYALDYNDCSCSCRSRGMVQMLKGLVFFHIVRDQPVKQSTTGVSRKKRENSENVSFQSFDYVSRYNNSVTDYECIQKKICEDLATYPEFKGKRLGTIIPL